MGYGVSGLPYLGRYLCKRNLLEFGASCKVCFKPVGQRCCFVYILALVVTGVILLTIAVVHRQWSRDTKRESAAHRSIASTRKARLRSNRRTGEAIRQRALAARKRQLARFDGSGLTGNPDTLAAHALSAAKRRRRAGRGASVGPAHIHTTAIWTRRARP